MRQSKLVLHSHRAPFMKRLSRQSRTTQLTYSAIFCTLIELSLIFLPARGKCQPHFYEKVSLLQPANTTVSQDRLQLQTYNSQDMKSSSKQLRRSNFLRSFPT